MYFFSVCKRVWDLAMFVSVGFWVSFFLSEVHQREALMDSGSWVV